MSYLKVGFVFPAGFGEVFAELDEEKQKLLINFMKGVGDLLASTVVDEDGDQTVMVHLKKCVNPACPIQDIPHDFTEIVCERPLSDNSLLNLNRATAEGVTQIKNVVKIGEIKHG